MRSLIESASQAIADLQYVSRGHWILRLGSLLALLGAAYLVTGAATPLTGPDVLLLLTITVLGTVQTLLPDADLGLVAIILLVIALAVGGPPSWVVMPAIGALLYAAHIGWAYAATSPTYAVVRPAVWTAMLRSAGPALAIGLLGGLVVILCAAKGLQLPTWVLIPGVLALIVLLVLLLPRAAPRRR